jgi:hypothetical protein
MMDASITRRSQPCWYKVDGVGNIAINDAFLLEGAIYHLLKSHFRQESYYVNLLELFHEVIVFFCDFEIGDAYTRFTRPLTKQKWGNWST